MTRLSCKFLISVLKFSIVIIHLNISILISVLKYSTKMTRLCFTSLISVQKFSIAIIHVNTLILISVLKNGDNETQALFGGRPLHDSSPRAVGVAVEIRGAAVSLLCSSVDFVERAEFRTSSQFYITNFGILHINISILFSVLKNNTRMTSLSCITLILILKFSIAIIHIIFQYRFQYLKTKR